jgi:hypothetical protein
LERELIAKDAGWITAKGGLNPTGKKIVKQSWEELSPAAKRLLAPHLKGIRLEGEKAGKKEAEAFEKAAPTKKKEPLGRVWTGNNWRPFMEQREIKKGKHKGKLEVTLPDGKKIKVDKDALRYTGEPEFSIGSKEDPVQMPPSLQFDEPEDYIYSGQELIDAIKYMQALELRLRAYEYADPQDQFVQYYKEQTEEEFDEIADRVIEAVSNHYDEWLKRHDSGEGWAEEILDPDDERGMYSQPSEAFTGGVAGVLNMGNWSVDVEQEILNKIEEEYGPEPIPDDIEDVLSELEDYGEDIDDYREELKEDGNIYDEDELRSRLEDLNMENDYGSIYAEDGRMVSDMLDSGGWNSPVGRIVLDVMADEGWNQWRNNWGNELPDAEERIREQRQRLEDAETPGEKAVAVTLALNEAHVYGTMSEHMDIGTDELDELSEMGQSVKNFSDLLRRGYKPKKTQKIEPAFSLVKKKKTQDFIWGGKRFGVDALKPRKKFKLKRRVTPKLKKSTIQDSLNPLWKSWRGINKNIGLTVHQHQSELPSGISDYLKKIDAENDIVIGVLYRNNIHLVADNIASPEYAIKTLFHEGVGHFGSKYALGDKYEPYMLEIYKAKMGEVKKIARKRGIELTTRKGRVKPSVNMGR